MIDILWSCFLFLFFKIKLNSALNEEKSKQASSGEILALPPPKEQQEKQLSSLIDDMESKHGKLKKIYFVSYFVVENPLDNGARVFLCHELIREFIYNLFSFIALGCGDVNS